MKRLSIGLAVAAFLVFAWLSLPSPDPARTPGPPRATGSGSSVVRPIDRQRGIVSISHGPVSALGMMPMTMSFLVSDKDRLANLQPKQKVEFQLAYDGNAYWIIDIK